jgi:hypothetical protein
VHFFQAGQHGRIVFLHGKKNGETFQTRADLVNFLDGAVTWQITF